jgi:hypothetical protein
MVWSLPLEIHIVICSLSKGVLNMLDDIKRLFEVDDNARGLTLNEYIVQLIECYGEGKDFYDSFDEYVEHAMMYFDLI